MNERHVLFDQCRSEIIDSYFEVFYIRVEGAKDGETRRIDRAYQALFGTP